MFIRIVKTYWRFIIFLILLYLLYKLCMSLSKVTIRGQEEKLYNALGKSFYFLFDKVPDLIIDVPTVNFSNFSHLLQQIPGIPTVPTDTKVNIDQPRCSFSFPNPVGVAKCVAQKALEIAKKAVSFLCVHENTLITMENNNVKKIKNINIGDKVLNNNNTYSTVFDIYKELVNETITLYGINDMEPFFTDSHPLCTCNNEFLSLDPESCIKECPEKKHLIKKLKINSKVYIYNNNKLEEIIVKKINSKVFNKPFYVYDLTFEDMENGTYIANNILVNSQEPNYLSNPKISCIIVIIAYNNYDNRDNYIMNVEDIINKTQDIEITKDEAKLCFNYICSKIKKNKYSELGKFANSLWIKYYNILNDSFLCISNRRINNRHN